MNMNMKKFLIPAIIAIVLIPSISFASTPADLEAKRIQLMEQIIVLLKARIEFLIAQLPPKSAVLGASISTTATSTATTTPLIKKKRSGGGGGGSRNSSPVVTVPVPLVLEMQGSGNTFTVTANQTLNPASVKVTLLGIPAPYSTSTALTLRAEASDGVDRDIELVRVTNTLAYEADMRARLPEGVFFTGAFEVIFPDELQSASLSYTVFIESNGVTRTINQTNIGFPVLSIVPGSDNPDARTIGISDEPNQEVVFVFGVKNEGGVGADIESIEIPFTTDPDVDGTDVIDEALLADKNGVLYECVVLASKIECDGVPFSVSKNSVNEHNLYVQFYQPAGHYVEGLQVNFSVEGTGVIATQFATSTSALVTGDFTSEATTLVESNSAILEFDSSSEEVQENSDATTDDNEGVYSLEFDVTAIDDDIWVNKTAENDTSMDSVGVNFLIVDGNGDSVTSGTYSVTLSSTADTDGTRFQVSEGETESFTLTVNFDPTTTGFYRVQLYSLNLANSNANPTKQKLAVPLEDYRTDYLAI